jgi:hypothetical protein
MSSFFANLARAPSLARPPSFNDFGGSNLGLDAEPRGSMESSASEFSPSSLGARASFDSRSSGEFFGRGRMGGGGSVDDVAESPARAPPPRRTLGHPRLDGPSER